MPGHLIVAAYCRYHLCTRVGNYLVSTVGEYVPPESVREIMVDVREKPLTGRGDAREADFMKKIGYVEIGCYRLYETMVFRAGAPCVEPKCHCGLPTIDGAELDMKGYNERGDADRGHLKMCHKWADDPPIDKDER